MPVEEVGVAGEVDAPLVRASTKPIASRVARSRRPLAAACSASTAVTLDPADVCRSRPGASSVTSAKPRRSRKSAGPAAGRAPASSRLEPPQRGQVGVVVVQVGDQHRVEVGPPSRRAGLRPVAAQRRRPASQHRIGEQADAVELDQDGRVADVGDPVVASGSGPHRSARIFAADDRAHDPRTRRPDGALGEVIEIEPGELSGLFPAPQWLRDLGFACLAAVRGRGGAGRARSGCWR